MSRSRPREDDAQREEPRPPIPAGTCFGEFEVVEPLAAGGMGDVYIAAQTTLGKRPVALKLLPIPRGDDAGQRRFLREAKLAAQVDHPNIVPIYGCGNANGQLYIAMRLVDGPTLRQVVSDLASRREPLREHEVRTIVTWAAQISDGLRALHDARIVHRDVTPKNIVIDDATLDGRLPRGRAILVDFGLARGFGPGFTETVHGGATFAYAPPEQLLRNESTPAVDVFGLGATLHDLLSQRRADQRSPASQGLEALAEVAPGIDPDLAAVVAMACDPKPHWRYPDGAALHADLEAWLAGRQVEASHLGAGKRISRFVRRHPTITAVAGLALIAALRPLYEIHSSVERVAAAAESGDLPRFIERWESLHTGWVPGAALAWWCGRFGISGEPSPSERSIRQALQNLKQDLAYRLAASEVQLHGLAARPRLVAFLAAGLRDSRTQEAALASVTRLFCETPIVTNSEQDAAIPLRLVLVAIREAGADVDGSVRDAISALSGASCIKDMASRLGRLSSPEIDAESRRLESFAAFRIVMRSLARDDEPSAHEMTSLSRDFEPLFHLVLRSRSGPININWTLGHAVLRLGAGLGFLQQRFGASACALPVITTADWVASFTKETQVDSWQLYFAAQQDSRAWLIAIAGVLCPQSSSSLAARLGDVAGWSDAERIGDLLERFLAGSDFSAHRTRARAERCGSLDFHPADPRSFLSAPPLDDARVVECDPSTEPLRGGCHAAISFTSPRPTIAGCVHSLRVRGGSIEPDEAGDSMLLLFRPGESELQFELEYPPVGSLNIHLVGITGSRWCLPEAGRVLLERQVGASMYPSARSNCDPTPLVIPVLQREISSSGTTVTLRLSHASTTTFRLTSIEIRSE